MRFNYSWMHWNLHKDIHENNNHTQHPPVCNTPTDDLIVMWNIKSQNCIQLIELQKIHNFNNMYRMHKFLAFSLFIRQCVRQIVCNASAQLTVLCDHWVQEISGPMWPQQWNCEKLAGLQEEDTKLTLHPVGYTATSEITRGHTSYHSSFSQVYSFCVFHARLACPVPTCAKKDHCELILPFMERWYKHSNL